jgi:hypothetical protein
MLMTKNKDDNKHEKMAAFHILKMFEGLPEELITIFVPDDKDALAQLEINIIQWLIKVKERERIMKLQKQYGLPLRPNQSLRDVTIRLKILELKKKKQKFNGSKSDDAPANEK